VDYLDIESMIYFFSSRVPTIRSPTHDVIYRLLWTRMLKFSQRDHEGLVHLLLLLLYYYVFSVGRASSALCIYYISLSSS
jgi:hypothetical protein